MKKGKTGSLFLLWYVLVISILATSIGMDGKQIQAYAYVDENGTTGAYKDMTCPHGGKAEQIGDACCYGCANTEDGSYVHRGKVNITSKKAKDSKYYLDEGDYNGPGYTTEKMEDGEGGYLIKYYYCYNCSGLKLPKNDPRLWMKTEYYNADKTLNTAKGNGGIETGGYYKEWSNNESRGDVPVRWCTMCGPKGAGYIITKYNPWHFPKTYTLSVLVKEGEGGMISVNNGEEKRKETGNFEANTEIKTAAVAAEGWEFSHWEDAAKKELGRELMYAFRMPDKDYEVYAVFTRKEQTKYKVIVEAEEGGRACATKETFYAGEEVVISAVPEDGYRFLAWAGYDGVGSSSLAETKFEMPAKDVFLKATFEFIGDTPIPQPTSIPVTSQPTPTIIPEGTPVPEEGVSPTQVPKHRITVTFDPDGGYVSPKSKSVVYGTPYGTLPTPEKKGYEFYGWVYGKEEQRLMVTSTSNVMAEEDHTLFACYTKEPEPTPEPTSIPTPEPTPMEDKEIRENSSYYFTTDQGYTMDAVAKNTKYFLAGFDPSLVQASYSAGGSIPASAVTGRGMSYTVGTDALGNEWYFIKSGNTAQYVHPKKYIVNGIAYDACSEEVKYITDLVFPEHINSGGVSYIVTSIGGGGSNYHVISVPSGDGVSGNYAPEYGYYEYGKTGLHHYFKEKICYSYGVLGNGYITSSGYSLTMAGNYTIHTARAEYLVYNTTLRRVVIPDTVQEIVRGAFQYCQALEKVEGCQKVAVIGEDAFSAATCLEAELSFHDSWYDSNGCHISEYLFRYYNGDGEANRSQTGKTPVMIAWEKASVLVGYTEIPHLFGIQKIQKYAFAYRDNMYELTLGENLALVEEAAFFSCKLDCLVMDSEQAVIETTDTMSTMYSTLGTKGKKTPTLLYVKGGAENVIRYGLLHQSYYKLMAGYEVVYEPNGGRRSDTGLEEAYTEVTGIGMQLPVVKTVSAFRNLSAYAVETYLALDEAGDIWLYTSADPVMKRVLEGYEVCKVEQSSEQTYFYLYTKSGKVYYTYCYDGVMYEPCYLGEENQGELGLQLWYSKPSDLDSAEHYAAFYRKGKMANSGYGGYCWYRGKIRILQEQQKLSVSWDYVYSGESAYCELAGQSAVQEKKIGVKASYKYIDGNSFSAVYVYCEPYDEYCAPYYLNIINSEQGNYEEFTEVVPLVTLQREYESQTGTVCEEITKYCIVNTKNGYSYLVKAWRSDSSDYNNFGMYAEVVHRFDKQIETDSLVLLYEYNEAGNISSTTGTVGTIKTVVFRDKGNQWYRLDTQGYCALKETGGMVTSEGWKNIGHEELLTLDWTIKEIVQAEISTVHLKRRTKERAGFVYYEEYEEIAYGFLLLDEQGKLWASGANTDWALGNPEGAISSTKLADVSGDATYEQMVCLDGITLAQGCDGKLYAAGSSSGYGSYFGLSAPLRCFTKLEAFPVGVYSFDMLSVAYPVLLTNGGVYLPSGEHIGCISFDYYFEAIIQPGTIMEYPGYGFVKWNTKKDGSGTQYRAGETIPLTSDLTLHAQWKEVYHRIRYDANGGVGWMADTILPYTVHETYLETNTFTRDGHTFLGWGLFPEGPVVFADGDFVSGLQGTITLYAQWEKGTYSVAYAKDDIRVTPVITSTPKQWDFGKEYTIKEALPNKIMQIDYNLNTESYPSMSTSPNYTSDLTKKNKQAWMAFEYWKVYREMPDGYEFLSLKYKPEEKVSNLTDTAWDQLVLFPYWGGEASKVALPMVLCHGYHFLGWSREQKSETTENIMTVVAGEESFYHPLEDGELLYAQYCPKEYRISLDWQGAEEYGDQEADESVVMVFDAVCPTVRVPKKDRYVFAGYFTEPNGQGEQYYGSVAEGTSFAAACVHIIAEGMEEPVKWRHWNSSSEDFPETLYAYWVPECVISYDPNYTPLEESCPQMDLTWSASGEQGVFLSENKFTRMGWHFVNWNTKADGSGQTYQNGQWVELAQLSGRVTLYAQWEKNTYAVQYSINEWKEGEDVKLMQKEVWKYGEEHCILGEPKEKQDVVSYLFNQGTKSTIPVLETELTPLHTLSGYEFLGWQLYEVMNGKYEKREAFFKEGDIVSNFTTEEGKEFVLFPEWAAESNGVVLPKAACDGYTFLGWSIQKEPEMLEDIVTETYLTKQDTVLYACWKAKEYVVLLDDRGATGDGHTETITVYFDKRGPVVTIPVKRGYRFLGYFTEKRGAGVQYYDANGQCLRIWTIDCEEPVLYACWQQEEVKFPQLEEHIAPTPLPTIIYEGEIEGKDTKALVYADDYNPETTGESDLQPYLVSDIAKAKGAIPGTEQLAFRAKVSKWLLQYKFCRKSGTQMIKVYVTVPYCTQYETAEEELVIETGQSKTYLFEIPKVWSYWNIEESGLYYPQKVTLVNSALKNEEASVILRQEELLDERFPSYTVRAYEDEKEHLFWDAYEEDGTPMVQVTLKEEQYIISTKPEELPDVDAYLSVICENAAWADMTQAVVRNDYLEFAGDVLISDDWQQGNGVDVLKETLTECAEIADYIEYDRLYLSGLELDDKKENGTYISDVKVQYRGHRDNVGTVSEKERFLEQVNAVNLHTPVVCDGILEIDGQEEAEELNLQEEKNFFTVRISNYGTHQSYLGYGTREFLLALSGKANVAAEDGMYLNQVRFPFDVYWDCKEDTKTLGLVSDDRFVGQGQWITLGISTGQFYLLSGQVNGTHTIEFRTIAVNCPKNADGTFRISGAIQEDANTDREHYVAVDTEVLKVKSFLEDFVITDTNDFTARERLLSGQQALTLKKGYQFTYQLWTRGTFETERAKVQVTPKFFWCSEDGKKREEVQLFAGLDESSASSFSGSSGSSTNIYTVQTMNRLEKEDTDETSGFQIWESNFKISAEAFCISLDKMPEFEKYSSMQTLTGKEDFIKQEGYLMVCFEIEAVSDSGEVYTFSAWEKTELAKDAIEEGWKYCPGDVIRYNLSETIEQDYEVGGVE